MTRRRTSTTDDARATVPAVVTPRRDDWPEWSIKDERRRLEAEIEARRTVHATPVYPREIAVQIAGDAARTLIPDWQLLRLEHRALFVQLLRAQPLLTDVRTILELRLLAHEAAAFLVGMETGRALERQHVDTRGRVRRRPSMLPQADARSSPSPNPNRLHLGADDD